MNSPKSTPSAALKPRKAPQQERSRLTIERIFHGTQMVMREKGVRAITTPAIAKASGVNVASIYQYFPNKESIIQALYENKLASVRHKVGDLLESLTPANWKEEVYRILFDIKRYEREVGFDRTIIQASQYFELLDAPWQSHADVVAHSISKAIRRLGSKLSDKALLDVSLYISCISMATWDFWRLRKSEPDIGIHQQAAATVALMTIAIESGTDLALPPFSGKSRTSLAKKKGRR